MFGKELILDLDSCDYNLITNKENIQKFIDELCSIHKMNKVGETIYEYFEPTEFNIKNNIVGYSVIQIISLSSITIHICDISRNVYLNFFTCGDIKSKETFNLIKKHFNPIIINKKIVKRGDWI